MYALAYVKCADTRIIRVFLRAGWVVTALSVATVATAQQADVPAAEKRVTALRISEPIQVDGTLDEPAWERAEIAGDFVQQVPDEFAPATRRTEVRFLYDDEALYVGAILHEERPEDLITNELKRDFGGFETDSFGLILDTFQDRQNSYGFLTNPGGAMRDAVNADYGRVHDFNWHGVWTVRTALLPNGWSVEYVIPFKTLRFPVQETQAWGMNMVRFSRRINEKSTWAPVPRQFTHYNVSYAGTLLGIAGVRPGRNLYVKPFATADASSGRTPGASWSGSADGGIDMKWGITSSLLLDASWRTDFSQVEADEQQINLTRFSLFFPEKREFFLESPGSFQIGMQNSERRDLVPFFTRRIGLVNGQPVPVIGGVRVTGRAGQHGIGVLNMQTEAFGGDPGDNYTALVLRRPLSSTTSVAGFYFGRESKGPDAFNRVAGFDFRFTPRRTMVVEAFGMRSGTAGSPGDWAGRAGWLLETNRHTARVGFLHVGESFRHDLGFVRRRGIGTLFGSYQRTLRPADTRGRIREQAFRLNLDATTDDRYRDLLTQLGGFSYNMLFSDGGQLTAGVNSTFERLASPFDIGGQLTVAPGDYRFEDAELQYSSNRSAAVSGSIGLVAGEFWTGTQRTMTGSFRIRVSAKFAASATLSRSVIELPEGSFTGDLVGLRFDTSFSPRMFLNAFIQYNGETDSWLSNVRYNLIHRPLSDIYIVWNETRGRTETRRALLLKYTHLITF